MRTLMRSQILPIRSFRGKRRWEGGDIDRAADEGEIQPELGHAVLDPERHRSPQEGEKQQDPDQHKAALEGTESPHPQSRRIAAPRMRPNTTSYGSRPDAAWQHQGGHTVHQNGVEDRDG